MSSRCVSWRLRGAAGAASGGVATGAAADTDLWQTGPGTGNTAGGIGSAGASILGRAPAWFAIACNATRRIRGSSGLTTMSPGGW